MNKTNNDILNRLNYEMVNQSGEAAYLSSSNKVMMKLKWAENAMQNR